MLSAATVVWEHVRCTRCLFRHMLGPVEVSEDSALHPGFPRCRFFIVHFSESFLVEVNGKYVRSALKSCRFDSQKHRQPPLPHRRSSLTSLKSVACSLLSCVRSGQVSGLSSYASQLGTAATKGTQLQLAGSRHWDKTELASLRRAIAGFVDLRTPAPPPPPPESAMIN